MTKEPIKSSFFTKPVRGYGIDLGTTNSCIATLDIGGNPKVIKLSSGNTTMPSCVMWLGGDNFIVGDKAYANRDKPNVAYSMKRLMGTDKTVKLEYNGETLELTPIKFSELVLRELVAQASSLYKDINSVVITVPAHFNNREVQDTLQAGKNAGLNVLQILREPTSASLLYDTSNSSGRVLVYDLGGGTFDVSLLDIVVSDPRLIEEANRVYGLNLNAGTTIAKAYNVRKNDGNMRLGGDDIDTLILASVLENLKSKGVDISKIPDDIIELLRLKIEQIKKKGEFLEHIIPLEYTPVGTNKSICLDLSIPYSAIQSSVKSIYLKTKHIIDDVLQGEVLSRISSITLVGGSTKNEDIKAYLRRDFPAVPVNDTLNPDESVALGAAIQANRLLNNDKTIDIQDVIPLSIGVLSESKMDIIVGRNTPIPFSKVKSFYTAHDNQTSVTVHVYQGNSTYIEECIYLGSIKVDNIKKAPSGEQSVDIKLEADTNGLLVCSVTIDGKTGIRTLKNLLGASATTKKLTSREKRVIAWKRKLQSTPSEDSKELAKLIEKYESGDDSCVKSIMRIISSFEGKVLDKWK